MDAASGERLNAHHVKQVWLGGCGVCLASHHLAPSTQDFTPYHDAIGGHIFDMVAQVVRVDHEPMHLLLWLRRQTCSRL